MIPQSTPLYAVASGDHGTDLLLVVGWRPVDDREAYPMLVHLKSTEDINGETTACCEHVEPREDGPPTLRAHGWLRYYDNREDAGYEYTAAAFPLGGAE